MAGGPVFFCFFLENLPVHVIVIQSITIDYMSVKLLKNRVDQMSTAISVRLPEKLAMDTDEIALETERARSFHIQKAVEMYFKEYADLQIALDRLNDPADLVISLQEMRNKLEL